LRKKTFLKSAEDISTVRFFGGGSLERLLMLVYPMVDFVALKRAALTTPFLKTICLHMPAVSLHYSFCLHLAP